MASIRSTVAETKKEAKTAQKGKKKRDEEQDKLAKLAAKRAEKNAAKAHTRDSLQALYLGAGDAFDKSITDFCERYADQNERDYQVFVTAVRSGRLQAAEGV